ncbi:MAG: isochorismatase family protein [Bdellovibrionales bacterium]
MKTDCLLVIDMQHGFMRGSAKDIIQPVARLAASYPAEKVYYLRYKNYPGSSYTKFLDWHQFMTTDQTNIVPEVYRQGCAIFDHYGYAPPPELIAELKKYQTVGICGVDTDACVMAAVFAVWDAEIRPIVFANYCASSDGPMFHKAALDLMLRQFGTTSVIRENVV